MIKGHWKYNRKSTCTFFFLNIGYDTIFFKIQFIYTSKEISYHNLFWTLGSAPTENVDLEPTQYFKFDHFLRSNINPESRFL